MLDSSWITPATIGGSVTAALAFGRWALRFWESEHAAARAAAAAAATAAAAAATAAAARREAFEAQIALSARVDNDRMIAALLESARSNAQLAGRVDSLTDKLDTLGAHVFDSISKVDHPIMEVGSQRYRSPARARTEPMGYPIHRGSRPGSHHDDEGG